jgi:hypothetical protein
MPRLGRGVPNKTGGGPHPASILRSNIRGNTGPRLSAPTFPATADLVEGTGTRAFGAVTTQAGDYLVVEIIAEQNTAGETFPVTSSPLAFLGQTDAGTGGGDTRDLQVVALDAAGGSRTVTITPSNGTRRYRARLTVVHGSDGPGTGRGTSLLSQTVSVTRQDNHSALFMAIGDFTTDAVGSPAWAPGGATVASQTGVGGTYIFGRWDDSGTAGTASSGITSPAYTTPSIAVLEMLGSFAGATAITLADSAAATDTLAATATVPLADSGAGGDALTVAAAVPVADAATGADTLTVTAAAALADTGASSDVLGVLAAAALADTGTGSDTLTVAAAVALADSGTAAETVAVAQPIAVVDTAAGTEALAVTAAAPLADAGSAGNTVAVAAAVPLADATTAADTITAAAAVPLADTAAAADTISVLTGGTPALPDAGTATDTLGVLATLSLADAAAAADTLAVNQLHALADSAAATDTLSAAAAVPLSQTGSAADTLTAAVTLALLDAATGTDTISLTGGAPPAPFAVLDSATAVKGPDAPGMRATAEVDATSGSHGSDSPGAAARGITEGGAPGITGQRG